ncbi:hypothetical protein IQ251_18550 [Saccharopolyspora sp. HNM0983]|uniref:SGNH hydrolase-type esterase domain-containing protein n=1 Tax=Saccharopolyspora montiporae TaxID=2781240 RepID=A0A929BAR8_9PSEU|nr:GDSL-type esterase/lipase family protein [Saccharopolyspora sp. HNM0983]MBE9376454.1 hypothetical protein [Saccharopolyspora sp. HNM0983]
MRALKSKPLIFLVTGSVLALALLMSDQYLPGLPMQPKQLPPAVVTIGDSTLSGEGGGDYEPETDGQNGNWCHRSPEAVVHQLSLDEGVTPINLACSGAKTDVVGANPKAKHAEGSQTEQLAEAAQRYRITDVVVQVGANDDPGFTDVVNRCVEAWARQGERGCADRIKSAWPERVEAMKPKVLGVIDDIRTAMNDVGYTPGSYSLIMQSYASPVGPDIDPQLQNLSGCPFRTSDLRWLRDEGVPELSAGLRDVAQASGARFLDLSKAAIGHEACSGDPQQADGEWFTRLTVDWESLQDEQRAGHAMQESFHANAAGHKHLAGCLDDFVRSDLRNAVCLPDDRGQLRAVPEPAASR